MEDKSQLYKFLDKSPSIKKYDSKLIVAENLKNLENIALMDGGELMANPYTKKQKYCPLQEVLRYFTNRI